MYVGKLFVSTFLFSVLGLQLFYTSRTVHKVQCGKVTPTDTQTKQGCVFCSLTRQEEVSLA